MRLVLGLGNPGERYARTRHNVAWWALDVLAGRWDATPLPRAASYAAVASTRGDAEIALMKPLTYMNLSGDALAEWMRARALDAREDLLVVSDDVYLPVGAIRVRRSGSSGGHRGLESIETTLESRAFARLRIGVGEAGGAAELKQHVLETFAPAEQPVIDEAVRQAADAVECWATEGLAAAMNRYNRRVQGEVRES